MLRWEIIDDKELFGINFKMYRDSFIALESFNSIFKNIELDHQAYKYLDSELFMYRILDVNFVRYMEERGDLNRIENILIPSQADTTISVL